MKYTISLGIALVCALTACNNFIEPPVDTAYGRISIISFAETDVEPQTAASARTVFPALNFTKYEYTFTKVGEQNGVAKTPDNGYFTLEVGSYTVAVQAFVGSAEPYTLAASGESSVFSVGQGHNEPVVVNLSAVGTGPQGEFTYTITYPAGAAVEITLQTWPALESVTLNPVNVSQGNGKTQTLPLNGGSYLLSVRVTKTGFYAGTSESVHIYPTLSTTYTKSFDDSDFLAVSP